MRREVVISGRDSGLGSMLDRLRESASTLGRELMNEALQTSRTGRDAVRSYEEQIRLLERRNRLHTEGLRQQAQTGYQASISAGLDPDKAQLRYQQSLREINRESKEDQLQVQLLRELIDTVKHGTQQEIRAERLSSENISNTVRRTTSEQGAEFGEVQRRMLEESRGGSIQSSGGSDFSGGSLAALGTGGNILGQRSFLGAASSGLSGLGSLGGPLAKAGIVGMILAALKGTIDIPREILAGRETSLSTYSALTGRGVSGLVEGGFGRTNLGQWGPLDYNVSRENWAQQWLPQTMRSRGSSVNDSYHARRNLELFRGGGIDQGTIFQAERYGRVGGGDAMSMSGSLYNLLRTSGAFGKGGEDFSRMNDLLSTLVSLQEQQLMASGVTGGTANLHLLNRIMAFGGAYQREDYTARTIGGINQGLMQGGSPEANAIKFDILRRNNPNLGYAELSAEMEKGVDSKGYLDGVMKMVKNTGGSRDSQAILLRQLLGGSIGWNQSLDILDNLDTGGLDAKVGSGDFSSKMRSRAVGASSKARADLDFEAETMGDIAEGIGSGIQEMISVLRPIGENIKWMKDKWETLSGMSLGKSLTTGILGPAASKATKSENF